MSLSLTASQHQGCSRKSEALERPPLLRITAQTSRACWAVEACAVGEDVQCDVVRPEAHQAAQDRLG
jgi:hypothetical protein